jgi:hypothetical protein
MDEIITYLFLGTKIKTRYTFNDEIYIFNPYKKYDVYIQKGEIYIYIF